MLEDRETAVGQPTQHSIGFKLPNVLPLSRGPMAAACRINLPGLPELTAFWYLGPTKAATPTPCYAMPATFADVPPIR